jgi:DNA-binding NtrC family response regulator
MRSVLVVDDKELMRDSVATTLSRAGFDVRTAEDGASALASLAANRPGCVVTDMRMPGMTGLELLERIRQIDEDLPVVMMTAFGAIDAAVRAMRLGAYDYLTKPFEGDELIIAVKRAIEHRTLLRENAILRVGSQQGGAPEAGATPTATAGGTLRGVDRLLGESDAMKRLRDEVLAVAPSQGTVLINGESGVGKEVVARAVHESSPREAAPFLAVNCAALSSGLLESELFGHERGAFTGAEKLRKGRFELSDRGTLLLDEISEIDPAVQAKLLRVLQERAFERVGSSVTIGVDVRVLSTSNRDLPAAVAKGDFRQDLYFRLNVLPISVPALRERAEDVGLLARHFIAQTCGREGRPTIDIRPETVAVMERYSWPGNVRELQNICERAVVLSAVGSPGGCIRHELVEAWLAQPGPKAGMRLVGASAGAELPAPTGAQPVIIESRPLGSLPGLAGSVTTRPLEDLEREAILAALDRFHGHRQRTAAALGIGVRTLGLKLKKWKDDGVLAEAS